MSTITDSLKNFYKKLGGNLSSLGPNSTSADIVDAMAEVYTDKEGTYVEVTESVTEGTKIATITTNNVDHDIYAPVELPAVTSVDEGKVLTVDSNGDWGADDIPAELPAVTSADEGKVLSVDGNGDWIADDVPSELPTVTGSDEGKVLTVDGNGDWVADDVPTELPAVTSVDEGKVLSVDGNGDWIADDVPTELPAVTSADEGKVLTVDGNGDWGADDVPTNKHIYSSTEQNIGEWLEGEELFERTHSFKEIAPVAGQWETYNIPNSIDIVIVDYSLGFRTSTGKFAKFNDYASSTQYLNSDIDMTQNGAVLNYRYGSAYQTQDLEWVEIILTIKYTKL